jgi:hypothetical protein
VGVVRKDEEDRFERIIGGKWTGHAIRFGK